MAQDPLTAAAERSNPQATDAESLERHFGDGADLLPLWIAEPYLDLAPAIVEALTARADVGWYGYETRPESLLDAFWQWMRARHQWDGSRLLTSVSPSVGTSIGVLIDHQTEPGDGVILQPPVFNDFKPLITVAGRRAVRNPLHLDDGGRYVMDLDALEELAADAGNRAMILCSPHNPVGRVWSSSELRQVATICARHDVLVIADEIHADLTFERSPFTPFATAAAGTGVRWVATHGPIKTFGLAGVCDTLVVTDDERIAEAFRTRSSQLHLTRNNVFGLAAFAAAYRSGQEWFDGLLRLVAANVEVLAQRLPDGIELIRPEGTFLAWLDLRQLGLEVSEMAPWLGSSAHLGLSPGHWFGREGAGFARMTIAAPTEVIETAVARLSRAVGELEDRPQRRDARGRAGR